MKTAQVIIKELKNLGTPARAKAALWYFKTGKGEYGYGDKFFGVTVPNQRKIAKRYSDLPLSKISKLLKNPFHECRLTALFILVKQNEKAVPKDKERIVKFYLKHTKHINNWDLVDSSAPHILGFYFLNRERKLLYRLACSKNLWERRIAILSTFTFIRFGKDYDDTLKIAKLLLHDKHDLIHKAVGWMLRAVGDQSRKVEENFLKKYAASMPRTMLRYTIEKFPEKKRQFYLSMRRR